MKQYHQDTEPCENHHRDRLLPWLDQCNNYYISLDQEEYLNTRTYFLQHHWRNYRKLKQPHYKHWNIVWFFTLPVHLEMLRQLVPYKLGTQPVNQKSTHSIKSKNTLSHWKISKVFSRNVPNVAQSRKHSIIGRKKQLQMRTLPTNQLSPPASITDTTAFWCQSSRALWRDNELLLVSEHSEVVP